MLIEECDEAVHYSKNHVGRKTPSSWKVKEEYGIQEPSVPCEDVPARTRDISELCEKLCS